MKCDLSTEDYFKISTKIILKFQAKIAQAVCINFANVKVKYLSLVANSK